MIAFQVESNYCNCNNSKHDLFGNISWFGMFRCLKSIQGYVSLCEILAYIKIKNKNKKEF